MKYSMLLSIIIFSSVHISAEFSDQIRKTSVKLFPLIDYELNGHFVISPISIFKLMASLSFDASGESKQQIKRAFYLPESNKETNDGYQEMEKSLMQPSDGTSLFTQNFLFIDNKLQLNKRYKEKMNMSSKPRTIVTQLDFTSSLAAVQANNVIEKSGANISNVLHQDIFYDSKIILTSVLSFKGLWSFPFNESDTLVEPFYDENGIEIGKVNMMFQKSHYRYSNIKSLNSFVLELPYGNDEMYCMLVVLPYSRVSVHHVSNNFESVTYMDIFNKLQSDEDDFGEVDIEVKLPRFKISTNVALKRQLNRIGVHDIFQPGLGSFKKITDEDIYISTIVHKADIEVTESGTVASGATAAYFTDRSSTPKFFASRPFIYSIMEKKTKTVIFTGIYSKPSMF